MENQPLISVIVPVYNAEATLNRCIDSLLAQSYTNLEILLVDDGSKDRSGEICDDYRRRDDRIKVFHKVNGGVSSARNLALEYAKGTYLTFCDSDDYVGKHWIGAFENVWKMDYDLGVQGIVYIINNQFVPKGMGGSSGCKLRDKQFLISRMVSMGVYGYPVTKLFKRSLIHEHNIVFDIHSSFREDEQFFSNYLEYVETYETVDYSEYYYYLPTEEKKYKGNPYYSLTFIFQSLDRIFDRKIPKAICDVHYVNIKDYVVTTLLSGGVPEAYMLDLLKRFTKTTGKSKVLSSTVLMHILCNSCHFPKITRKLVQFIHAQKK